MREPQTKAIGGVLYEVTPLPAGKGLALLTRLAKLVAPALAAAPSLKDIGNFAGEAIAGLLENLTEEDTAHVCRVLAENTRVQKPTGMAALAAIFDLHFQGDYLALVEWARFALEVNYAGFFAAITAKAPAAPAAPAASETTAPAAS